MTFPTIRHIDDVLPAIAGRDEFVVGKRDGYQFIDYNYAGSDTFDCPIRRECRGLKFDMDGKLIARPFHKFFNLHEKPAEVPALRVDNHTIMEKLDGSMVHTAVVGGKVVFMTRAGISDQAKSAKAYVDGLDEERLDLDYYGLSFDFHRLGFTPIFEFTAPDNQIVIRYSEPKLTLLAARFNLNGQYLTQRTLAGLAADYDVPVVRTFDPTTNLDEFVAYAQSLTDTEGFVIRCGDWMGKVKADAYVASHRAKSGLLWEKDVLRLVLENKVDDVVGLLEDQEAENLTYWADTVNARLTTLAASCDRVASGLKRAAASRAEYAKSVKTTVYPYLQSVCFKIYDGGNARESLLQTAMKQCSTTTKAREFLSQIGVPEWAPVKTFEMDS